MDASQIVMLRIGWGLLLGLWAFLAVMIVQGCLYDESENVGSGRGRDK